VCGGGAGFNSTPGILRCGKLAQSWLTQIDVGKCAKLCIKTKLEVAASLWFEVNIFDEEYLSAPPIYRRETHYFVVAATSGAQIHIGHFKKGVNF
jgi:hypothetical protein